MVAFIMVRAIAVMAFASFGQADPLWLSCFSNDSSGRLDCNETGICAEDTTLGMPCEDATENLFGQSDDEICLSSDCGYTEFDSDARSKVCCPERRFVSCFAVRSNDTFAAPILIVERFCYRYTETGKTCKDNDMCESGVCVNGLCIAERAKDGEPCDYCDDCEDQKLCASATFGDETARVCCNLTDYTPRGSIYCPLNIEDGLPCPGDDHCISGSCLFGTCANEDQLLGDGELCDSARDCASGECGALIGDDPGSQICCSDGPELGGYCTGTQDVGEECLNDRTEYCAMGFCSQGVCTDQLLDAGETCQQDSNCNSTKCARLSTQSIVTDLVCCPTNETAAETFLFSPPAAYCTGALQDEETCNYDAECASTNCLSQLCSSSNETDGDLTVSTLHPGTGCFSSHMVVDVQDRGPIYMKDLKIGDMVKGKGGVFSMVYSLGHESPTLRTEFLQIEVQDLSMPLQLTKDHLVYVNNDNIPRPGAVIEVGTKLVLGNGDSKTVTRITKVWKDGMFGPLTNSGTIVVNNVVASSYVALKPDSAYFWIADINTGMSMQWIGNVALAPRRIYCRIFLESCRHEKRDIFGEAQWITDRKRLHDWLLGSDNFLFRWASMTSAVGLCALVGAIEMLGSIAGALVAFVLLTVVTAGGQKKIHLD